MRSPKNRQTIDALLRISFRSALHRRGRHSHSRRHSLKRHADFSEFEWDAAAGRAGFHAQIGQ